MADYITRDEFEAAIAALQCVGDQQTIDVTQSPGGQTIRSIQVIGDDADTAAESYISVSYDSVAEEFTITITDVPYLLLGQGLYKASGGYRAKMSATYVYDLPVSGTQTIYIGSRSDIAGSLTVARLYWWSSTALTSDAPTAAKKTDAAIDLAQEFIVSIVDDGTYTVNTEPAYPFEAIIGTMMPQPYLSVISNSIRLNNVIKPDGGFYNNIAYSAPFDDQIIIGYNGTGGMSFDEYANRATYSSFVTIGEVVIDSGNVVRKASLYPKFMLGAINGASGTATSANTLTISNGIVTVIA